MNLTHYHSQYFAYDLTKRCASDDEDKLAAAAGAQVDFNPQQVEAALFAFRSPLSKGALIADEVGLGKTIEARAWLLRKSGRNASGAFWSSHPPTCASNGSSASQDSLRILFEAHEAAQGMTPTKHLSVSQMALSLQP